MSPVVKNIDEQDKEAEEVTVSVTDVATTADEVGG